MSNNNRNTSSSSSSNASSNSSNSAPAANNNKNRYGRHSPPSATNGSASIPISSSHYHNRIHQNNSPDGKISPSRSSYFASPAGVSTSPPNLHFAGSKYFDAPSPNSLPRPPTHWTSPSDILMVTTANSTAPFNMQQMPMLTTSKRRLFTNDNAKKMGTVGGGSMSCNGFGTGSDIFSHNLKLILNVEA